MLTRSYPVREPPPSSFPLSRYFLYETEGVTFIGNERQELIDEFFDPDGDFYEAIAPYKSDMDTYSIDEHTLEIDFEEANR